MQHAYSEKGEDFWHKLVQEDVNDPKLGWRKSLDLKETDKTPYSSIIHQRPIEGSRVNMMRAESVWRNISVDNFNGFIEKMEDNMKDHPNVIEFAMVEKNENEWIMYSQSKMPMMMSARDNLIKLSKFP
jgi:hypothetical protein